uniref:Uncharacterized protein n=1 Tax=Plectus sambesii TaxID=2011161 RepID=A0A914WK70_9BILA
MSLPPSPTSSSAPAPAPQPVAKGIAFKKRRTSSAGRLDERVVENLKSRQSPQISLIEELNALFGRSATNSRFASSVPPGNEKPQGDTKAQKQRCDEDGQRKESVKELKDKNAASTSFVSTTNLLPPPPSNPPKETRKVVIVAEKKEPKKKRVDTPRPSLERPNLDAALLQELQARISNGFKSDLLKSIEQKIKERQSLRESERDANDSFLSSVERVKRGSEDKKYGLGIIQRPKHFVSRKLRSFSVPSQALAKAIANGFDTVSEEKEQEAVEIKTKAAEAAQMGLSCTPKGEDARCIEKRSVEQQAEVKETALNTEKQEKKRASSLPTTTSDRVKEENEHNARVKNDDVSVRGFQEQEQSLLAAASQNEKFALQIDLNEESIWESLQNAEEYGAVEVVDIKSLLTSDANRQNCFKRKETPPSEFKFRRVVNNESANTTVEFAELDAVVTESQGILSQSKKGFSSYQRIEKPERQHQLEDECQLNRERAQDDKKIFIASHSNTGCVNQKSQGNVRIDVNNVNPNGKSSARNMKEELKDTNDSVRLSRGDPQFHAERSHPGEDRSTKFLNNAVCEQSHRAFLSAALLEAMHKEKQQAENTSAQPLPLAHYETNTLDQNREQLGEAFRRLTEEIRILVESYADDEDEITNEKCLKKENSQDRRHVEVPKICNHTRNVKGSDTKEKLSDGEEKRWRSSECLDQSNFMNDIQLRCLRERQRTQISLCREDEKEEVLRKAEMAKIVNEQAKSSAQRLDRATDDNQFLSDLSTVQQHQSTEHNVVSAQGLLNENPPRNLDNSRSITADNWQATHISRRDKVKLKETAQLALTNVHKKALSGEEEPQNSWPCCTHAATVNHRRTAEQVGQSSSIIDSDGEQKAKAIGIKYRRYAEEQSDSEELSREKPPRRVSTDGRHTKSADETDPTHANVDRRHHAYSHAICTASVKGDDGRANKEQKKSVSCVGESVGWIGSELRRLDTITQPVKYSPPSTQHKTIGRIEMDHNCGVTEKNLERSQLWTYSIPANKHIAPRDVKQRDRERKSQYRSNSAAALEETTKMREIQMSDRRSHSHDGGALVHNSFIVNQQNRAVYCSDRSEQRHESEESERRRARMDGEPSSRRRRSSAHGGVFHSEVRAKRSESEHRTDQLLQSKYRDLPRLTTQLKYNPTEQRNTGRTASVQLPYNERQISSNGSTTSMESHEYGPPLSTRRFSSPQWSSFDRSSPYWYPSAMHYEVPQYVQKATHSPEVPVDRSGLSILQYRETLEKKH